MTDAAKADDGRARRASKRIAIGLVIGAVAVSAGLVSIRASQVKTQLASFEPLNARYAAWGEPVPPNPCRRPDEVPLLRDRGEDSAALAARDNPSPELRYLEARLAFERGQPLPARFGAALTCRGFTAAVFLAARAAEREGRRADALMLLDQVLAEQPDFAAAQALAATLRTAQK